MIRWLLRPLMTRKCEYLGLSEYRCGTAQFHTHHLTAFGHWYYTRGNR